MNTNSRQQIRGSAKDSVDIHAIDGLLWGLPVRLGLAAKQQVQDFPHPQDRARRGASDMTRSSAGRQAA